VEIAAFFRPYPQEQAISAIADQSYQFWTRWMRAALVEPCRPDDPHLAPRVGKAPAKIRLKQTGD
jgi:formate dehydrogenase subunit delta